MLISGFSLYAYFEERMYSKLVEQQAENVESYRFLLAPYHAFELSNLGHLLQLMEAKKYCQAKQILAIKINGIIDVSKLKEDYELSDERMTELKNLADEYEPFKNGKEIGKCE